MTKIAHYTKLSRVGNPQADFEVLQASVQSGWISNQIFLLDGGMEGMKYAFFPVWYVLQQTRGQQRWSPDQTALMSLSVSHQNWAIPDAGGVAKRSWWRVTSSPHPRCHWSQQKLWLNYLGLWPDRARTFYVLLMKSLPTYQQSIQG